MSKEVSKYVSYKEVTRSATATRHNINNNPSEEQLELIRAWAVNVFDPIRVWVGGPVKLNSVFRSADLNAQIGGSNSSQHSVGLDPSKNSYGAAGDLDDTYKHKTNAEMFDFIKNNLVFDQLIWEYEDKDDEGKPIKGNPAWVHVSYRNDGKNRMQILIARKGVKPTYINYNGNEDTVRV